MNKEMNKEIEIPEGYEARIEGNKVILELKRPLDPRHSLIEFIKWACDKGSITPEQRKNVDFWLTYLEKQKEHVANSSKTSTDDEIRKRIINILGSNTDAHEEGWAIYADEIAWLKERQEPKPQEWSKEDKKMQIKIMSLLSSCCSVDEYEEIENWFKSLCPQQKVELNDEDKTRFMSCLLKLRTDEGVDTKNSRWFETRFASLCTQPHWKPSHEQVARLHNIIVDMKRGCCYKTDKTVDFLESLHSGLEKLM